ncbi:MAG: Cu2+-exporting ATPase [Crocinitomicaceae bacterium]|jgi:Cu2+-exporting ATPase
MTCDGCKAHVQKALSEIDNVESVVIDLETKEAEITMSKHINIDEFKAALKDSKYGIHHSKEDIKPTKKPVIKSSSGVYYCPMHCEGDKTYDKPMACPVCGMDLVAIESKEGEEDSTYKNLLRKFWIACLFTLPIFSIAMVEMIPNNSLHKIMPKLYWNWTQFVLSLPVVFYATWMFFERAYSSIVRRSLNMFTLIGIGAGVAWSFSLIGMLIPSSFPDQFKSPDGSVHIYFEAATVILTLVLLGQLLEARAHSRTNSAIKELLKMAPNTAFKIENGVEIEVSVEDIAIGDLLRVKPGSKIPVDGILVDGESSIDESMISGEPIPVDKIKGSSVSSGTINGTQSFIMKAEKIGGDTLLSQIIHMVNNASRSRAPIQKLADTISGYFVPIVILVSIITFAVWFILGPEPKFVYAFVNAIAVLIIACPCALGLATPMSIMVGVGKGAQSGILIKDAESLEKMNKIDTLIIDKTGTITEGKPSVEKFVSKDIDLLNELIISVASVNQLSEHPLARATVEFASKQGLKPMKVEKFESFTGKGVQADYNDQQVLIGNHKLLEENRITISEEFNAQIKKEQLKGKTVPLIAINGLFVGFIVISDAIKTSSMKAIQLLRNKGIDVIMMTGDNEYTARAVAEEVGIQDYEFSCLPQDKLNRVDQLKNDGKKVAMVGDGINDAPALALSDVGIAMGTGSDVAIESASITLVKGDLMNIVKARTLSEKVMTNIRQNLFFALFYNIIGIPVAAGILYPAFGILLSPMIAALAMSFSSVSVITNALRLKTITINN